MYIYWTILGIFFLFLDFNKTNTWKLACSVSCLFCAIINYKYDQNLINIFLYFGAFFYLFNFLIGKIMKKEKKEINSLILLKNCVGKTAAVKKDIGKTLSIDGFGIVEFQNNLYQAKSIDDKEIKAGSIVEIISRENLILNVKVKTHANIK